MRGIGWLWLFLVWSVALFGAWFLRAIIKAEKEDEERERERTAKDKQGGAG